MTIMEWIMCVNLIAQTTLIVLDIVAHVRAMKEQDDGTEQE